MGSGSRQVRAAARSYRRKSGSVTWLLVTLAVAFVGISTFAAVVLYASARDLLAEQPVGTTPLTFPSFPNLGGSGSIFEPAPQAESPQATWNGTDRVSVLLLGIDQREGEKGPFRTDTMMLLSMDPVGKTASMLSIPRDLWVPIADYGYGQVSDRINTANFRGDLYNYPGGGPALAAKTVELNLGIRVDYTARINFVAFEEFIDMIGGIDVDVPYAIDDPRYPNGSYGYDPFYISAGPHHLDGPTALKYARTRHTPGSDFDRAKRQQQVIMAVRQKVVQPQQLAGLLLRAPQLIDLYRNNMETTLSLDEMIALARLASQIPGDNIHSGAIGAEHTNNWITPNGEQVLIPLRDEMASLIAELFPPVQPVGQAADPQSVADEAAMIVVLNGGAPSGSASQLTDYLSSNGYQTGLPGNAARQDFTSTILLVHSEKPATVQSLAELLNIPPQRIQMDLDETSLADVEVVIGADYLPLAE